MLTQNKVLKLFVPFTKGDEGDDGSITITGRASTNDVDRQGDIIVSDAWKSKEALASYLKNPVILAFHDSSKPIGKTIAHEVDDQGLSITGKISKAAGSIVELIKEGILGAFSVGFILKDADFDPKSGIFAIKALELLEISVVSIPANQNALFSIEKNFSNPNEYQEFRNQFIKSEVEEISMTIDKNNKEVSVAEPVNIADLATQISKMVRGEMLAEQKAAADRVAAETAEAVKIEAVANSAAEKLVAKLRTELVEREGEIAKSLAEVRDAMKQGLDKEELEKALTSKQTNKMEFTEKNKAELTTAQKDAMIYASKISGRPIQETKLFKDLVVKSGTQHWASGVGEWEDEYSTRIENALRQDLVVESLFRTIPMSTPTLNMPINPEAGDATWIHSAAFRSVANPSAETGNGTNTSTGTAVNHEIDDQVLIAYKLATREYVGYEEEEDSIVALAPIINEAIARRMARSSDRAILRGGGVLTNTTGYDPITGVVNRGAGHTPVTNTGGAAWEAQVNEDAVANLRRNMGLYGLDNSKLVYLVSHDYYYELLKLDNFKTVDVLGAAATIITGQVGSIFGVPVKISQMFDNAAITAGTVGTALATLVYPSNFVVGVLRGITTEAAQDVINQKRAIVSSRRFAFQDIIAGVGCVNLEIAS